MAGFWVLANVEVFHLVLADQSGDLRICKELFCSLQAISLEAGCAKKLVQVQRDAHSMGLKQRDREGRSKAR